MESVSQERHSRSAYKVRLLDIYSLVVSKCPLRAEYECIAELANSIKMKGLLEPLIVRPADGRYEVVAGNRRLLACRELGLPQVPCVIKSLTDKEAYELALTENIQRRSLDLLEEAEAFRTYITNFGWGGTSALARRIGKSEEYVSHRVLLLNLPKEVLRMLSRGKLSATHAKDLMWIQDERTKIEIARIIETRKLSTRDAKLLIKRSREQVKEQSLDWLNDRHDKLNGDGRAEKAIMRHGVMMIRSLLYGLDGLVHESEGMPELHTFLREERYQIHEILDRFLQAKVEASKEI